MALASTVNYRSLYFEHPDLTKIFDKPSEDELKANAQSVYSPLGGGQHGHLGLVVNPFQYTSVSNIPFITPPNPRQYVIIPNEATHIAQARLEQHQTVTKLFREVTGVKKALLQQIVQTVDDSYLKSLRHPLNNTLNHLTIYEILNHLFRTYGQISPTQLASMEEQVKQMPFDPTTPVDDIYSAIDKLGEAAYHSGSEYSNAQKINLGLLILGRPGIFKQGMRIWFAIPLNLRTWENFKLHFRDEQNVLESIMDGSIANDDLHQANIVQQVLEGMQSMLLHTDQDQHPDHTQAPPPAPAPASASVPPVQPVYQANAVQQQDNLTALMTQMAQMQTLIMSLQQQIQNNSNQTQDPPVAAAAKNTVGRTEHAITPSLNAKPKHRITKTTLLFETAKEAATKDVKNDGVGPT